MKVVAAEKIGAGRTLMFEPTMPNDNDLPATKGDLNEVRNEMHGLRSELKSDMQQLRADVQSDMQQLRDELIEKMREMQTEVLRAFYDWARPVETRLRGVDELSTRLGLLEERVSAIERRNLGL
jgi:hypothetical protein